MPQTNSDKRGISGAALGKMIRNAVKHSFPGLEISDKDMDSLAQLCAMSTVPTGEEDPRALIRPLADAIVDAVATSKAVPHNPILGRLHKIFCIEWAFRHDQLNDDWIWEWKGPRDGQLHYNAKVPLDQIKELAL
jgi:hypothetical protein